MREAIAEQLRQELPEQAIGLVWLGQASVMLVGAGRVVSIDPFLSPHAERLTPPPLRPEDCAGVDVVCITHEHWDHLDSETCRLLAHVAPDARFVCPEPIVELLVESGITRERVVGVRPGDWWDVNGTRIWPVAAKHGLHTADAYSFGGTPDNPRFLGYVVELGRVRTYHAGDTIVYAGLEEAVRAARPQVALLPINGRDWYREQLDIVGNMDEREAAHLARAIGAEILVPLHYDMFAANLGDPGGMVRYVQERKLPVHVVVPTVGRPIVIWPVGR